MPKRTRSRSKPKGSPYDDPKPVKEPAIELDPSYDLAPLEPPLEPEVPPKEPVEGVKTKKKLLKGWKTKAGLALLGTLLGVKAMRRGGGNDLEMDMSHVDERNRNENILRILESARMDRSNATNRQQLAQNAPDLYSSVMAGRQIPKGSVVLGGQQREDLMQQLVMAMDKGQYQKQNPLSELMG